MLCACGNTVTKRFRDGILHIISKALPQRSVIKHCDRASVDFSVKQRATQAFLEVCAPGLDIENNFVETLLCVRKVIAENLKQNPALYGFADRFFCAKTLCDSYELVKKSPTWSQLGFLDTLSGMLPEPPAAAVHALHVLFAQEPHPGPKLEDVVEEDVHKCRFIKRRLRKAALRKALLNGDNASLAVRTAAYAKLKTYSTTTNPFGSETPSKFFACTNCGTNRSTLNGFGANRVLFCTISEMLTCGKKHIKNCQNTPLAQVPLGKRLFHTVGKGSYAQCAHCQCVFKYNVAQNWCKGVLCCSNCYYTVTACTNEPCCDMAPPPKLHGSNVVRETCRQCQARPQRAHAT